MLGIEFNKQNNSYNFFERNEEKSNIISHLLCNHFIIKYPYIPGSGSVLGIVWVPLIHKLMYRYHKNYSRNSVYEQANAQTFEKFPKHEKLTQTKFK